MRTLLIFSLFTFTCFFASAQGTAIGDTNNLNPHASAILDLQSVTKGFLLSKLTTTQRNAIQNPAEGLMIFNKTTHCIEVYLLGGGWQSVKCDCTPPSSAFTSSPAQPAQGSPVTFTPTTPGTQHSWTFQSGSPATSTQQNPVVTWSQSGTYTVTLTLTAANGCSSTTTSTITVTNCGGIGANTVTFNAIGSGRTGSVQTWTVPPGICSIRVNAFGAQGGGNLGGQGARIQGEFTVTPGEVISMMIGQRGGVTSQGPNYCGGGGGGTFVYRNANDALPLVAAAGGGGHSEITCGNAVAGGPGSATTTPTNGSSTQGNGSGGANGNGGNGGLNVGQFSTGGGGGGWLTNGQNGLFLREPAGVGGLAPRNGGTGGLFTHSSFNGADGGYGGGGGASDNTGAGGGGGGFNGGGGGNNYGNSCSWGSGGGGGSYNGGTNQTNQQGVRAGHGQVIITY